MAFYEKVVLRLSGGIFRSGNEALGTEHLERIADELAKVVGRTRLVVVVGGGNIARGRDLARRLDLTPQLADNIGIMATILNAYVLGASLTMRRVLNVVLSTHNVGTLIPAYHRPSYECISECWHQGQMVIVGGGTGRGGGVTTDTAAVRLAKDLRASIVLKGTNVNGIYSVDPRTDSEAELIRELSCHEFRDRGLSQILDPTAVAETTTPVGVFNILTPGLLFEAIAGRLVGSLLRPAAVATA